jgi:ribosomal protein L11 methyltransferase
VLVPGGIFIASGIIEEKKELVCQSLQEMGMEVVEMIHQEGWVAIVAKKW